MSQTTSTKPSNHPSPQARATKVAAVYCRTSKERAEDQDRRLSLPEQETNGTKKAHELGYQPKVYIDSDRKGSLPPRQWLPANSRKPIREALSNLYDDVLAGNVSCIICCRLDRLTRLRTEDGLRLLTFLSEHNIELVTYDDTLPSNMQSASGKLTLTMLLGVASFNRELIGENVKRAKRLAMDQGRKICSARLLGYVNGKKGQILINPDTATVTQEMFDRRAKGESLIAICDWLNQEHSDKHTMGGKIWAPTNIRNMFNTVSYIGKAWNSEGNLIDGPYPPIIKPAIFNAVQQVNQAAKKTHIRKANTLHVFGGLIRCSCCSETLKANWAHDPTNKVFSCRSRTCTNPAPIIQEQYYDALAEHILAKLVAVNGVAHIDPAINAKLARVETNIAAVKSEFANGNITLQDRNESLADLNRILAKLQASQQINTKPTTIEWAKATAIQKRVYLNSICRNITLTQTGLIVTLKEDCKFSDDLFTPMAIGIREIFFPILMALNPKGNRRVYCFLPPKFSEMMAGYVERKIDGRMIWSLSIENLDARIACEIGYKRCISCNKAKPIEVFKKLKDGNRYNRCPQCSTAY
jgi:DNA invertase Pin-like site-specific DNA recombinase